MDKTVRLDNTDNFRVTGIVKDPPANASVRFNFVVPVTYQFQKHPELLTQPKSFSTNNLQLFVKLKPGIPYAQVAPKIRNIEHTETGNTNAMLSYVTLQPMERWHLYSNYVNGQDTAGFLTYVKMFSMIGLLVLLIACINFINLTTARSEKRAREVGVRKAIGSQKKDLIFQFLTEAFLLTGIAFQFSFLLVVLALPAFNQLTGTQFNLPYGNVGFWGLLLGCLFFTSVLAGSRPAFYLSSFNAVKVLKGTGEPAVGLPFKERPWSSSNLPTRWP